MQACKREPSPSGIMGAAAEFGTLDMAKVRQVKNLPLRGVTPLDKKNGEGPGAMNRTGPSVFLHSDTKICQTMNRRTMTTRSLLTF